MGAMLSRELDSGALERIADALAAEAVRMRMQLTASQRAYR
jgi:hypothetical protein